MRLIHKTSISLAFNGYTIVIENATIRNLNSCVCLADLFCVTQTLFTHLKAERCRVSNTKIG